MTLNRRPTTDAQWARDIDRRLRALESPRMITIGAWAISVSPISGDLVADHIPTGRRHVVAASEPDMKE